MVPDLTKAEAYVLSQRGGDFALHVGQDLSIGYTPLPTTTSNVDPCDLRSLCVYLYVEETFTFRVNRPAGLRVAKK